MADTLQVELREQIGTKRMRRLRQTGKVPAVLYGHKEAEQHLILSVEQIMAVVRHGGRVVKLQGAVTNDALIREVQWDTFGKDVLHVDFMRVDASERVSTRVTVEGKGVAAGQSEGGVVEWVKHQIEIECPALAIPDILIIRLEGLHLNQSIHAKDVPLPEGATLLGNPEELLVHCVRQHLEEIPTTPAAVLEPEVIKKEKKEGEEDAK
jgi:large subunit ribosomal protein L25